MTAELYAPKLLLGGGELSYISKEIGMDMPVDLKDITTLGDAGETNPSHKFQKNQETVTLMASGDMPHSELASHWIRVHAAAKHGIPASNVDRFGAAHEKWAALLPSGYGEASSVAAGNTIFALQIEGSNFTSGSTASDPVTWAATFGARSGLFRGEHVADVLSTTVQTHGATSTPLTFNRWTKAFTPTANRAAATGHTRMKVLAFLDFDINGLPRYTSAARDALASVAVGTVIFNTDTGVVEQFNNNALATPATFDLGETGYVRDTGNSTIGSVSGSTAIFVPTIGNVRAVAYPYLFTKTGSPNVTLDVYVTRKWEPFVGGFKVRVQGVEGGSTQEEDITVCSDGDFLTVYDWPHAVGATRAYDLTITTDSSGRTPGIESVPAHATLRLFAVFG